LAGFISPLLPLPPLSTSDPGVDARLPIGAVASPGFVARRRRVKARDFVMEHSRRTGPGAADCLVINSFVTNAVLVERAVSF